MRLAVSLFVLFISPLVCAQQCTVHVQVAVLDNSTGEEIDNLKAGDFVARMGNASLPVDGATRDFNNRVLLLLETDGSATNAKLGEVVDSVTRWARQAPEGKPLAFGVFAERAVFTKGFSADPKERTDAINSVIEEAGSLGKRVALYDALLQAQALFGPHQPGDTVLLVSDPYDNASRHSRSDVVRAFTASGTRLSVVIRQPRSRVSRDFTWANHTEEEEMFENLTARTGGVFTVFGLHLLRYPWKGYMLELKLPENDHRPHKWKVRLRNAADLADRHPRLYFPEQLLPCEAAVTPATKASN